MCPKKKEVFKNVPVSGQPVTKGIDGTARNTELQLQYRQLINFAVQITPENGLLLELSTYQSYYSFVFSY